MALADPFINQNLTANLTSTHVNVKTPESYTSIILLLSGIVAARFGTVLTDCDPHFELFLKVNRLTGLWVADLSVNQSLQQVEDEIRGTINGVQSSINMIFDTAKFLMVIACPWPETFGILVCASFLAICCGYVSSLKTIT